MLPMLYEVNPDTAGMARDRVDNIRRLVTHWVNEGKTPAVTSSVARRGGIVHHEAIGNLSADDDSPPLRTDSLFPLASITKPMVATAAMILVEDGLLNINDPVQDYIPEFVGEDQEKVMVYHLLTHTSGLNEEMITKNGIEKWSDYETPILDETEHPIIKKCLDLGYVVPLATMPGEEIWNHQGL